MSELSPPRPPERREKKFPFRNPPPPTPPGISPPTSPNPSLLTSSCPVNSLEASPPKPDRPNSKSYIATVKPRVSPLPSPRSKDSIPSRPPGLTDNAVAVMVTTPSSAIKRRPRRPTHQNSPLQPNVQQQRNSDWELRAPGEEIETTTLEVGEETRSSNLNRKSIAVAHQKADELSVEDIINLRENNPTKLWNLMFRRVLGNVSVNILGQTGERYNVNIVKEFEGEIILGFSFDAKSEKYTITKNTTLLSESQIIGIALGGMLCGTIHEVY